MLSKEEIEKAKEIMEHWVEYEEKNKDKINRADELIGIQKTLLQYIDQLEQENKKQNESAYWKGYIQKQNEAAEICKQCKYIKKVKQLETEKRDLIEKLEEESSKLEKDILTMSIDTGNTYSLKIIHQAEGMKEQNDRILSIIKLQSNKQTQ